MYIFIAILAFGVLIFVHELGHFLAARASNIRVTEFALGMGPVLWKRQGKETLYSLRLLPIGGFCAMEEDEASEDARAFTNATLPQRLITLLAGSFMNFAVGFLLVLLLAAQAKSFPVPIITGFMEGCPYEGTQGLLTGDELYRVNGERVYFSHNFSAYVTRTSNGLVDLVVIRDGQKVELADFPMAPREYPKEGGGTQLKYGLNLEATETGLFAMFKYSWYCTLDFVRMVRIGLTDLLTGGARLGDFTGVVGIVGVISETGQSAETVQNGIMNVLNLIAFIAVNLAVMNLLPIPALDGGRVVGLLLTAVYTRITHRTPNPKVEGYIHYAGLVLLMGLMIVVAFNDIVRLVRG